MIIQDFKVNFKVVFFCGVFGILLLVLGVGLGYGILPGIVYRKIIDSKVLRQCTEQWNTFMNMSFPFQFKVYLFSVQNPGQILMGEKPIVKERGPYVYKLFRWKDDVVWNDGTDEISYYEYSKFDFDQEASGELTDQETVTLLNVPYLNLLYKIESNPATANFLGEIEDPLKYVFSENNGLFLKTKVKDFLFNGIRLCKNGAATGGFLASMVCKLIKKQVQSVRQMRIDGSDILYATFHYKNNSHMGYMTVKSGQTDERQIGTLTMMDNKSSVSAWLDDKYQCNKVDGVTSVFPANVEATTRFTSFSGDICRSIGFDFSKVELVNDIRGYRYVVPKTTFSHSKSAPENQCFCVNKTRNLDDNYGCLYDGIVDLSTCTGAPVMLSFPHLLHADSRYIESVEGLEPNRDNHEMFITLEPVSGTPLNIAKRVQFNMFVRPVEDVTALQNVSRSLMPMFWIEESVTLPEQYVDLLKKTLIRTLWLIDIVKFTLLAIAIIIISVCLFLFLYAN